MPVEVSGTATTIAGMNFTTATTIAGDTANIVAAACFIRQSF
ncbi:MAG TPA: hypothetical protein VHG72_09140 [Polyangia bacterium]|nr:hypothetical protein [Polyangia bacterium]